MKFKTLTFQDVIKMHFSHFKSALRGAIMEKLPSCHLCSCDNGTTEAIEFYIDYSSEMFEMHFDRRDGEVAGHQTSWSSMPVISQR